ncbi:MAG: SPOR domain-containing protein [Prevotellaceae bacterium]|jgi:nucleoid DNA-binding protein|nr:SPOR domain-containing protein [Prevotellaceae bacterium]
MEEIAELFIELLKKHNRVSLPSMGAFVASPQAAVIEKGKIIPPSKKVTFVKSEIWNDGLLENLYAERYGRTIEEAREELHRIISDIRFELDANGKITLPGLGTLKQTASREINFGLVKNLNLQKDSYGLEEVSIAPKTPYKTTKEAKDAGKANNIPLLILLCIMLAAIAALALFFTLNRIRSDDNIDALIVNDELQAAYFADDSLKQNDAELSPEETAQPDPAKVAAQHPLLLQKSAQPPAAAKPQQPATPRCEFCTVVASFNTREGARIKAQRYRAMGYKSRVVDGENNRYRVMLGCYPTLDAAKKGLSETTKFVKDAWVLEVCK